MKELDDIVEIVQMMADREFSNDLKNTNVFLYDDGTYSVKCATWHTEENDNVVEVVEYWWDNSSPKYEKFETSLEPPYPDEDGNAELSFKKDSFLQRKTLDPIEPTIDRIEDNKDFPLFHGPK